MKTARLVVGAIWTVGITLIVCLNLIGSLPRMYMRGAGLVGTNVVTVFEALTEESGLRVPIRAQGTNGKELDTGRKVNVYLLSSYKDDVIAFYPRTTLLIIGGMLALQIVTRVLVRLLVK